MKRTLLLTLALVFVFTGCGKKQSDPVNASPSDNKKPLVIQQEKFVQNPNVEKYRTIKNCDGLPDWQDCYANHAVWDNDPSLCSKMGQEGLDSLCLQYYYIQSNNPKACDKITSKGSQAACKEYFKNGKK